jgi:hypothetical protein
VNGLQNALRVSVVSAVLAALAFAAVALATPLPRANTAHDRAAWRTILHWPAGCEDGWKATNTPGAGLEIMPAKSSERIVAVECFPGAYQGDAMLYIVKSATKTIGPLHLKTYSDPGNGHPRLITTTVMLGVLDFSRATNTLTLFDKYRGVGDCGIFSTYRLTNDALVLKETRVKSACNGKPPYDPSKWPRFPG